MTTLTESPRKPSDRFPRRRDGIYYYQGKQYISVTSVLACMAKPQLVSWAARTSAAHVLSDPDTYDTAEKAAASIYQVRDRAADRGSLVHSFAEALSRGAEPDPESLPESARGYGHAFRAWYEAMRPTPLFTEANVYSDRHGYAGTTDLIAAFPDRKLRLIDLKTTSGIYREVGLQLAAYRHADFILPRQTQENPHPEPIPMPPVSETCALRLGDDGSYEYRVLHGDFDAFLHLLAFSTWFRQREG